MRPSILKPLVISSGLLLLPLAGFAAFLLVTSPEDYRAQIINDTKEKTGAELTLAEPLHWQLWPFGIRLGEISLRNTGEQTPLLDASSAAIGIQPLSLFSGEPQISSLALEGAHITISENAAGDSNWDAILQRLDAQADNNLSRITLHDSNITLKGQGDGKADELLISTLTLDAINVGRAMPLTAAFSWSRQSSEDSADKSNLLSQSTLTASISRRKEKAVVDFHGVRLNSEISSTLFPGNFKLLLQGDFSKEGRVLASKNARIVADYKNLTMAEPLHANLSSTVLADFAHKTLSLDTLQFSSAANKKIATEISTRLAANWGSGEVRAQAFKLSTHLDNPLNGQPLPLQANTNLTLKWPQGDMTLAVLPQLASCTRMHLICRPC